MPCWVALQQDSCQVKSASLGHYLLDCLWLWLCGCGQCHPTPAPCPGGKAEQLSLEAEATSLGKTDGPRPMKNHFPYFTYDVSHPIPSNSVRKGKNDQCWGPGEIPVWVGSLPRCGGCLPMPEEPCTRSLEEGACLCSGPQRANPHPGSRSGPLSTVHPCVGSSLQMLPASFWVGWGRPEHGGLRVRRTPGCD